MVEEAQAETVISAKDEIMKRIRAALGERRTDRESDYAYIVRHYCVAGARGDAERLELFVDRLHDYGASVVVCAETGIPENLGKALRERNLRRIVTGSDFPARWIPSGFDFRMDYNMQYEQIESFDGVITPCAIAIAETGTIVLRHADEEPRRALSLLPDHHLCIVFEEQIVETVPQGVEQMAAMGPVPLTTISGPSATSDIEMTRVKGVHGPRTLDVMIVRR